MSEAHKIVIRKAIDPATGRQRLSVRGPLYEAWHAGELLDGASTQPMLDGCRALAAKGLTGPVEMWDAIRPYPRLRSTIEVAAKLTVREGSKGTPRLSKWTPYERGEEAASE